MSSFGRSTAHTSTTGNPATVAFTTIDGERVLVLLLKVRGATNRAGGAPTYAGRTMVQADSTQKAAASPEGSAEIWYLLDPPIGAYNLVIPNTGGLTMYHMIATGRAVPGGRLRFGGASGANGTSTNPAPGAIVTTKDGALIFSIVATGATTWAPSARVGTQLNDTDDGADGTGRQYTVQSTFGSINLGWTFATSDDWGAVAVAFVDIPPVYLTNYQQARVGDGMSTGDRLR